MLSGEDILLLYTQKYRDYSLPGGGIDDGESLEDGLIRELQEETGALDIQVLAPFGRYEEFRPWYREGANVVHMDSFCYVCRIDTSLGERGLGETRLEAHEIKMACGLNGLIFIKLSPITKIFSVITPIKANQ